MDHPIIRDFLFAAGSNDHLDPRVFLELQPLVAPAVVPAPPQLEELGDEEVPDVHSSLDYSLVLYGVQQVPSIWDFAQRVLANPGWYPHVTAVHETRSVYYTLHGWVQATTRVFNTFLEEWAMVDGYTQTVVWYQLDHAALPAAANILVGPEEVEAVDLAVPEDPNFLEDLLADVPDEVWDEEMEEAISDDGYRTGEGELME
jgi:hypothetical protein